MDSHRSNIEFLLACARGYSRVSGCKSLDAPAVQVPDWGGTLDEATNQGVMPLLAACLHEGDINSLPEVVRSRIEPWYLQHTLRNLSLFRELVLLLEKFANQGIRVISLKGPVLAHQLYGDIALRAFGDLDLLIPQSDFSLAKSTLLESGYRAVHNMDPPQERMHLQWQGERLFIHERTAIAIDLHWRLLPPHFVSPHDFLDLWSAADTVYIGSVPVKSLSQEHGLIFLCAHGTKHSWKKLSWIIDLGLAISKGGAVITRVPQTAERWGCARMVRVGLRLAHQLGLASLPEVLVTWVDQDRIAVGLAEEAWNDLSSNESQKDRRFGEGMFYLRSLELWRSRLRFIIGRVCIPSEDDLQLISIPEGLRALYWIVRPIRLASKQGICKLSQLFIGNTIPLVEGKGG